MNDNDSKAYFNEEFHFNDSKKNKKTNPPNGYAFSGYN